VPQGQILFEVGAPGREYYILLRGKCEIYLPAAESTIDANKILAKTLNTQEGSTPHSSSRRMRTKSNYEGMFCLIDQAFLRYRK